ncbi:MAG: DUF58 domain-containing protein [Alphaproteobacteria bacterium]|nr:DUF58 domain-containing protein [Alphaproteobacteria bacterium]
MIDQSRNEAAALAGDLPGVLLEARRLAAAAPGLHGRRRAGEGEAFWQYRDHRSEDGARLVDWRRSARGERLYVREREREAAQNAAFWLDPHPGFDWRSDEKLPTKRRRALVLSLALATLFARGGERVSALGAPTRAGPRAVDQAALDLVAQRSPAPEAPRTRACLILASDFYEPLDIWRARLARLSAAGANGACVMICDPAEEDFPYSGRTLFHEISGRNEIVLGRAEHAREAFAERLAAHRRGMREMARALGFLLVTHRTDHPPAPVFALLAAALSERGL